MVHGMCIRGAETLINERVGRNGDDSLVGFGGADEKGSSPGMMITGKKNKRDDELLEAL